MLKVVTHISCGNWPQLPRYICTKCSLLQIGKWWPLYQILKHILISILKKTFLNNSKSFPFKHSKLLLKVIKAKEEPVPVLYPFIKVNLKLPWYSKSKWARGRHSAGDSLIQNAEAFDHLEIVLQVIFKLLFFLGHWLCLD